MSTSGGSKPSRRDFLRGAAIAAGVLAVPGAIDVAHARDADPRSSGRSIKIGVILPQSTLVPMLADNLLSGFVVGGEDALRILPVAVDSRRATTIKAMTDLIAQGAQVIVALGNRTILADVRNLLATYQIPLIALSSGENVLRPTKASSYVFHHSLHGWQSAWAMGTWAAQHMGTTALIASSFYESGYDTLGVWRAGFEAAGGRVVHTAVTHMPSRSHDLAPLMAQIEAHQPALVYAAYSGKQAADFMAAYTNAGFAGRLPVAVTPFMVEDETLAAVGKAAVGTKTCAAWSSTSGTTDNQRFLTSYKTQTGRNPDAFALLGYETARLITGATAGAVLPKGDALLAAFRQTSFAGPRGTVLFDSTADLSLAIQDIQIVGGRPVRVAVDTLAALDEADDRIAMFRVSQKTGWTNPYLCV